jgi:RNA polymerase sigma-70 factor (ECF subfamily)
MINDSLHKLLLKRDNNTFEQLMDDYSKLLWVVCAGILKSNGAVEDIEECVSDCFVHLWEYPEKYDPRRGSLKTYLCIVARSKAVDRLRKHSKVNQISLDNIELEEKLDIEDDFIIKEEVSEVLSVLDQVKSIHKQVFLLRYIYELMPQEISSVLNICVKEVSNKLFQCKRMIREKMGD